MKGLSIVRGSGTGTRAKRKGPPDLGKGFLQGPLPRLQPLPHGLLPFHVRKDRVGWARGWPVQLLRGDRRERDLGRAAIVKICCANAYHEQLPAFVRWYVPTGAPCTRCAIAVAKSRE